MLIRKISLLLGLALCIAACNTPDSSAHGTSTTAEAVPNTRARQFLSFGEQIDAEGAIPFAQLTSHMGQADSMRVKVAGRIDEVCQKKGCWITLTNATDEGEEELFVKFKDYAFFMPTDAAGQEVVLDGYAFREVTSVDELRHYAEDAGESAEAIAAITEPQEELKFMASGVLLKTAKQ